MRELEREQITFDENGEESGRVLSTVKIRTRSTDEFYMTYIKFMGPIFNIKSANDMNVLAMLCTMMNYDTPKVYLPKERREEICEKIGIVSSVLSRSLASLKQLGLISGDNGTFEINPYIFWKGNSKKRIQYLKSEGMELRIRFKIEESPSVIQPSKEFENE